MILLSRPARRAGVAANARRRDAIASAAKKGTRNRSPRRNLDARQVDRLEWPEKAIGRVRPVESLTTPHICSRSTLLDVTRAVPPWGNRAPTTGPPAGTVWTPSINDVMAAVRLSKGMASARRCECLTPSRQEAARKGSEAYLRRNRAGASGFRESLCRTQCGDPFLTIEVLPCLRTRRRRAKNPWLSAGIWFLIRRFVGQVSAASGAA